MEYTVTHNNLHVLLHIYETPGPRGHFVAAIVGLTAPVRWRSWGQLLARIERERVYRNRIMVASGFPYTGVTLTCVQRNGALPVPSFDAFQNLLDAQYG
jgi:hypothetical protein